MYIRKMMIALLALSVNSYSADFSDCTILDVRIGPSDENAHVKLDCTVSNAPQCANAGNYVAFDRSTDSGKTTLSVFLTAFVAGLKVTGTVKKNECPSWQSNVAELNWVIVSKP